MASDSDFASKYTNANLAQNAAVYDSALFAGWIARLDSELQHYKPCLPYGVLVYTPE